MTKFAFLQEDQTESQEATPPDSDSASISCEC